MSYGADFDSADEELVAEIKKWAVELSKTFANYRRHNRILDQEIRPRQRILAARGRDALLKLLPLTEDENPAVRWIAAAAAYDAAPAECRFALEKLMGERKWGVFAFAEIYLKDPDTAPSAEEIERARIEDSNYQPPRTTQNS